MKPISQKKIKYNLHLREISLFILLFILPMLLYPFSPSPLNIFKEFVLLFWNSNVYFVISIFLINSGLVFTAMYFLHNEDIKFNLLKRQRLLKRTFLRLFFGYFIYLFYLISLFIVKSTDIQKRMGKDMYDVVYTFTLFSFFLVFLIIYLTRKNSTLGDLKLGSFFLVILGSTIIFETFIGFSPLGTVYKIFLSGQVVEKEIAIQFIAPYYFSLMGGTIFSIIDLHFFSYPNKNRTSEHPR